MHRAAIAVLLFLAACAMPTGVAVEECNTSWRGIDPLIATGAAADQQTIPISCIRTVDEKRISIGFEMPPGPDCYELASIDLPPCSVHCVGAASAAWTCPA